jgi:hypothetical protein
MTFTCNAKDCPNEGVAYPMETEIPIAECGGCGLELEGVENV